MVGPVEDPGTSLKAGHYKLHRSPCTVFIPLGLSLSPSPCSGRPSGRFFSSLLPRTAGLLSAPFAPRANLRGQLSCRVHCVECGKLQKIKGKIENVGAPTFLGEGYPRLCKITLPPQNSFVCTKITSALTGTAYRPSVTSQEKRIDLRSLAICCLAAAIWV